MPFSFSFGCFLDKIASTSTILYAFLFALGMALHWIWLHINSNTNPFGGARGLWQPPGIHAGTVQRAYWPDSICFLCKQQCSNNIAMNTPSVFHLTASVAARLLSSNRGLVSQPCPSLHLTNHRLRDTHTNTLTHCMLPAHSFDAALSYLMWKWETSTTHH